MLTAAINGTISCSSENQGPIYNDTCSFECNDGYEIRGSEIRTCQSSGTWNGGMTTCEEGMYTCMYALISV